MENKNVFVIIFIIIAVFFLSGDKNITTKSLNNNAFPLLLILIIFYVCYNNFSIGLVFICLGLLVISTTNIKDIIIQRLDYHTDNRFSERLNELFSYSPETSEHLETTHEEEVEDDIFDSTEGLDDISYNDFKEEVGKFNGESIEQKHISVPDEKPIEQNKEIKYNKDQSNILDVNDYNNNNGRDINSMFEELNSKLNSLRSK